MNFALIIPTWNAGDGFIRLLDAIAGQSVQPRRILVIDSSSTDQTPMLARERGCEVLSIGRDSFNHGATRQLGADMAAEQDFLLFLTQDALPAQPQAFDTLLGSFADPGVGAAYGRQLPHREASLRGAHARIFNYPGQSRVISLADRTELGIKTAFFSNSFGAYRRAALIGAGGFPRDIALGEDTFTAARMLLAGWKIAYCAEAQAYHSHDFKFLQEIRRYYDTGAFHGSQPWIRQTFGTAGGEGLRFVRSELRFLWRNGGERLILPALITDALKFAAYQAGLWFG